MAEEQKPGVAEEQPKVMFLSLVTAPFAHSTLRLPSLDSPVYTLTLDSLLTLF